MPKRKTTKIPKRKLEHPFGAGQKRSANHELIKFLETTNLKELFKHGKLSNYSRHSKISIFEFNGKRYCIKWTKNSIFEGKEPERVRQDIYTHQKALRDKKISAERYVLRTPKVHFARDGFIVMEHIKKIPLKLEVIQAQGDLARNFNKLKLKKQTAGIRPNLTPQTEHFFPGRIINGKIVFYTAYDYI